MNSYSRQTGSGQDYAIHGRVVTKRIDDMTTTTTVIHYVAVMDGHGTDKCIDLIRGFNFDAIASAENPATELFQLVQMHETYGSGATFTFARTMVSSSHHLDKTVGRNAKIASSAVIEIYNSGDSETHLFMNGELAYKSDVHSLSKNQDEVDRLHKSGLLLRIKEEKAPFPISDTHIDYVRSDVGIYTTGETLVPSQSLGHNNMTGFKPSFYTCDFNPLSDRVRIVCGSDGFWDMMGVSETDRIRKDANCYELVEEAERKWRQPWKVLRYNQAHTTTYGNCIDDISVAILDTKIVIPPSLCIPYSPNYLTMHHVKSAFESILDIRKITEIEVDTRHKAYFLWLNPSEISKLSVVKAACKVGGKVKVWYNDDVGWYWHLTEMRDGELMEIPDEVVWMEWMKEKSVDYATFRDTVYVSETQGMKMDAFLTTLKNC